jgi:hypothetical protein
MSTFVKTSNHKPLRVEVYVIWIPCWHECRLHSVKVASELVTVMV